MSSILINFRFFFQLHGAQQSRTTESEGLPAKLLVKRNVSGAKAMIINSRQYQKNDKEKKDFFTLNRR